MAENESKEITISVKVDKNLAKSFKELAKANNRNQSMLLRDFIIAYVEKRGQLELDL